MKELNDLLEGKHGSSTCAETWATTVAHARRYRPFAWRKRLGTNFGHKELLSSFSVHASLLSSKKTPHPSSQKPTKNRQRQEGLTCSALNSVGVKWVGWAA